MTSWQCYIDGVHAAIRALEADNCPDPFFRGQSDSNWKLVPGLARQLSNPRYNDSKEARMYWDFRMVGSHLIPPSVSEWTVLYYMQHFGLPTRLLDWTTNFARALFFAIRDPMCVSPTVFILNPYEMNSRNKNGTRSVSNLNVSFKLDYVDLMTSGQWPSGTLAVMGDAAIERLRHQKGAFTLHGDLDQDIEVAYSSSITKHVLPDDARQDASQFLRLAGVDEFTIYSDLDGLARMIRRNELGI